MKAASDPGDYDTALLFSTKLGAARPAASTSPAATHPQTLATSTSTKMCAPPKQPPSSTATSSGKPPSAASGSPSYASPASKTPN